MSLAILPYLIRWAGIIQSLLPYLDALRKSTELYRTLRPVDRGQLEGVAETARNIPTIEQLYAMSQDQLREIGSHITYVREQLAYLTGRIDTSSIYARVGREGLTGEDAQLLTALNSIRYGIEKLNN